MSCVYTSLYVRNFQNIIMSQMSQSMAKQIKCVSAQSDKPLLCHSVKPNKHRRLIQTAQIADQTTQKPWLIKFHWEVNFMVLLCCGLHYFISLLFSHIRDIHISWNQPSSIWTFSSVYFELVINDLH